jgi:ferredoxin--NADP+ reductase
MMSDTASGATLRFAIVGAGPAGFYTAEALSAQCPGCRIDIIERLPTPYGLVRSGVAPDHQSTKTIEETFEQIARQPNVQLVGNVEVDRDVSLDELRGFYDAIVLASGSPHDAPLDVPGAHLRGVFGASAFVGWYNAHPDHAGLAPDLDHGGAVIIGNGNVAIDVARVLSKPVDALTTSDIAHHALGALETSGIADTYIVGRRGALDAKFTTAELRELGELDDVVAVADPGQIPGAVGDDLPARERRIKAKNLECLQAFAKADPESKARRIHLRFNSMPVAILGRDRVEGIRFERTTLVDGKVVGDGTTYDIPCGLVVSAIGYRAKAIGGLELSASGDRLVNDEGRIDAQLYVVGWLRRGPSGKIGTNRGDGEAIAERIGQEIAPAGKPGFDGLRQLLMARGVKWTGFSDWKTIEAAEKAAARTGAPRQKFASVADMLGLCAPASQAASA